MSLIISPPAPSSPIPNPQSPLPLIPRGGPEFPNPQSQPYVLKQLRLLKPIHEF
ncbi:hypothetical protein FDUTEX481_05887 [Tolypothrix sp. PCC 7601]|nr:hypothetical protein FDUTEX481_05887 [Tolypothrix sp. PCC 7601]